MRAQIEKRLRGLAAAFGDAGSSDDFDELFLIIHRPGWTTPAEIALIHSLIDAAENAINGAVQLRGALVDGARAVGETSALPV